MKHEVNHQFIEPIAKGAGRIILEKFGKIGVHHTKNGPRDVVTEADIQANEYIISAIKKQYPEQNIISEETDQENFASPYTWIIDPLDGTLNFSKGIPLFATMIAFAEKGIVVASCIYDPVHDAMYSATRGSGAFLNGEKIFCSDESDTSALVGVMPSKKFVQLFGSKIIEENHLRSISLWCAGLSSAWVASGKRDWWFESGLAVWDFAPGSLLLEEAGCLVTDEKGNPWTLESGSIFAANPQLHKKLIQFFQI